VPGSHRNLVMITLDCVRPDHLGCYGYGGVETTNLDALAAEGVLFEQAVTHAPNTWVAHACLFTGLLPPAHGLRAPDHRLRPQVITLAQWLSLHGYSTAGFPGNSLLSRAQGFDRGFQTFDEPTGGTCREGEVLWRNEWKEVLRRVREWLSEVKEPFFLWVHYIDTHHLPRLHLPPYYRDRFAPRWQYYDGKISYADHICVGELLDLLEEAGVLMRTLLLIFSDHGEELHPDGRPLHDGGLGEDVIRIPLILWGGGEGVPASVRIRSQARLVDLFPTVCDLLSLPHVEGLQGRSLAPLWEGHSSPMQDVEAYLENWPKGYMGLRTPEWKVILKGDPRMKDPSQAIVTGLYHLPSDPREEVDLAANHPAVAAQMRRICLEKARGAPPALLSQEERRRIEEVLEALGYL